MPRIYLSPSTQDWNMYVTGSGSEEYNMNLLADALVPYLLSNGIQYQRNRPEMTAGSSIREANQGEYDLYLALHSNAAPNYSDFSGIYTYYHPSSGRGARLAQAIQTPLTRLTGGIDRGIKSADFVVLRETEMCAVLVEMGFMTNHDELMDLIDDGYQDKLAQGIAEGIVTYLNGLR